MIRGLNVILLITSLFALVGVYAIKYGSEDIARQKNELSRTIGRQQAQLSSLRAEWSYFNQPSYIAPIVARHSEALGLQIVSARQFALITDLPMRPERQNEPALDALFAALDAGIDPIGDKLAELLEQ